METLDPALLHRQRIDPHHPGDVARMWSVVEQ